MIQDGHKNNRLKITSDIESLSLPPLGDNLYYYEYKTKALINKIDQGADQESPEFIALYNTFVGGLYENIIYEHLMIYAKNNRYIDRFILKGPHQDDHRNIKNGFLMDNKSQIVFKSGYKDISEFDAMFFSKDSVYFVEMTVVKNTIDLRKRLKKKRSLLRLLFPRLNIRCLVVVTKEAMGLHMFPDFCTIWTTDTIDVYPVLEKIRDKNFVKQPLQKQQDPKMVDIYSIEVSNFKYYSTIKWILYKLSTFTNVPAQVEFLKSKNVENYFNIYSKIFISFISKEKFSEIYFDKLDSLKELMTKEFIDDRVYVAVEKSYQDDYKLVYYVQYDKKLKKIEQNEKGFKTSDKQPKGFTYSEIKFLKHQFKEKNRMTIKDIKLFKGLL